MRGQQGDKAMQATATLTTPVSRKARIQSIDSLRGLALFGILLLNIIAFANPFAAYIDPRVDGAGTGINLATFMTIDILAEGSMRTLFSMLFGAGMLIFLNKPAVPAERVKALYYRRSLLLVAFGLFNAYVLIWPGDILYTYGMTALVLYYFRNLPARRLCQFAVVVLLMLAALHSAMHIQARLLKNEVDAIHALAEGTPLDAEQSETLATWDSFLEQQFMAPDDIAAERQIKQGGYAENFVYAASANIFIQTIGFIVNTFWDALAMMLLGMAFMKWGFFDASRDIGVYWRLCLLGFGLGIPLNAWETLIFVNSDFQIYWSAFNRPSYDLGRLLLAIGYTGLIMLICKSGLLSTLMTGLARVGQMALSNYLMQTVICNLLFLGFGFGLAGQLQRVEIYLVVVGVWVFQYVFSVWWLSRFRFGPMEWLWRSLTYGNRQPLRLTEG
jgi:uncharacterized protein